MKENNTNKKNKSSAKKTNTVSKTKQSAKKTVAKKPIVNKSKKKEVLKNDQDIKKVEIKEEIIIEKVHTEPKFKKIDTYTKMNSDVEKDTFFLQIIFIFIVFISFLFFLSFVNKTIPLKEGKNIVATLEGKKFSSDDLYNVLREQNGYKVLMRMIDEWIIKHENLNLGKINEELDKNINYVKEQAKMSNMSFENFVKKNNYETVDAFEKSLKYYISANELVIKYVKKSINEKALEEFYDQKFSEKFITQHILIKFGEDQEKALEKANEIITKLNAGENFTTLAKNLSEDFASAKNGGEFNFRKYESVPEYYEAVAQLENGKYTSVPVQSAYGYHVILRKNAHKKEKFDDAKDIIRTVLAEEKLALDEKLYNNTLVEIRKKHGLEFNDKSFKKKYNNLKKEA